LFWQRPLHGVDQLLAQERAQGFRDLVAHDDTLVMKLAANHDKFT
jgi:hypothetical protein